MPRLCVLAVSVVLAGCHLFAGYDPEPVGSTPSRLDAGDSAVHGRDGSVDDLRVADASAESASRDAARDAASDAVPDAASDAAADGALPDVSGGADVGLDGAQADVVLVPPTLTGTTPNWGFTLGGLEIQVAGAGFDPSTTVVIGATPCVPVVLVSSTALTCTTQPQSAGDFDVTVSGAGGSSTIAWHFEVRDFSQVRTIAGTGAAGAANGPGNTAQLSSAVNHIGLVGQTLLVADGTNFRIRTIDLSLLNRDNPQAAQVVVGTLAGTGADALVDSTDGTGATAAFRQLDDVGVVIGSTLYALHSQWAANPYPSALRTVDLGSGNTQTAWTGKGTSGLAWDGGRYIYATDCRNDHDINRFDLQTKQMVHVAGAKGPGDADGSSTVALFNCPYGLALDGTADVLYVSDYANNKIRRVGLVSLTTTTVVGDGQPGSTDSPTGTSARLYSPAKLSLHGTSLLVADHNNCTVRRVDVSSPSYPVTTIAGVAGDCGVVDGPLATARLQYPGAALYVPEFGIFVSSTDSAWEVHGTSHRIRLIR